VHLGLFPGRPSTIFFPFWLRDCEGGKGRPINFCVCVCEHSSPVLPLSLLPSSSSSTSSLPVLTHRLRSRLFSPLSTTSPFLRSSTGHTLRVFSSSSPTFVAIVIVIVIAHRRRLLHRRRRRRRRRLRLWSERHHPCSPPQRVPVISGATPTAWPLFVCSGCPRTREQYLFSSPHHHHQPLSQYFLCFPPRRAPGLPALKVRTFLTST
jgi:heme exporter protein D